MKSRTKNIRVNKLYLIVSIFILFIALKPANAGVVKIFVDPAKKTVTSGETFNLNVVIEPHGENISAAQANITFDPNLVNLNNISEGNLLKQDGAGTFFFISKGIDNKTGAAGTVVCSILGMKSVSRRGIFFTINATAVKKGKSAIELSNFIVSTSQGKSVSSTKTNRGVLVSTGSKISAETVNIDSKTSNPVTVLEKNNRKL